MNKVMLIGNVGKDPQVKYLDTGVCVAQLNLATTERGYTLQNGVQVPDHTDWHTCIFWRRQAEIVEKYVHKGDKLYVEGKLQGRDWVDKQGVTRHVVEIMVDNLELLTPKSSQTSSQTANESTADSASTPAAQVPSENNGYPF